MDNLDKLFAVTAGMSYEDRRDFENSFIGTLSVLVDPKTWDAALDHTTQSITPKEKP